MYAHAESETNLTLDNNLNAKQNLLHLLSMRTKQNLHICFSYKMQAFTRFNAK